MILSNRPIGAPKPKSHGKYRFRHLLHKGEPVCGTFRNWDDMVQVEYIGDVQCSNCKATHIYKNLIKGALS
jgi:hypothetical protein